MRRKKRPKVSRPILREDASDLAAIRARKREPSRPFEAVLKGLKKI
jgi:hypothetical protein